MNLDRAGAGGYGNGFPPRMSKQYNKVIKRHRRAAYLKRKKAALRAARPAKGAKKEKA